jgi:hypothetical protein
VIATVPTAVETLLTADVAREIARAYGDRPIYPDQIVIDRPDQERRRFPGWPEPVLVLADENQGACSWGVPLDGGPNGGQVLVGSERTTVTYTGSVEDFIAARRWDYECVNAAFCVSAQASALDEVSLGYLRGCCAPSVTTHGWPGMRQYRFEDQQVRVLLWSDTDQCDWLVSAMTEDALTDFTADLLTLSSLRTARWADEA